MDCPYCSEEVRDTAIVCRHCGRDLALLRPVVHRFEALELRVMHLESVSANAIAPPPQHGEQEDGIRLTRIGYVATLVSIACFASLVLYGVTDPPVDMLFQLVPEALFLGVGVWLGLRFRGRHARAYLTAGLLLGVGYAVAAFVLAAMLVDVSEAARAFAPFAVVHGAAAILLVYSGGVFGDWLEARRNPSAGAQGWATSLARRVVRFEERRHGRGDSPTRVKRLAEIIQGFAPILSLIGTLLAAWLGQRVAEFDAKGMRDVVPTVSASAPAQSSSPSGL